MKDDNVHKLNAGEFAKDAFTTNEVIHPSDIDSMAQEIVDRFFEAKDRDPERNRVIIDVLNAELALIGAHRECDPDVFEGIVRIRKAVVEALDRNPKFQLFRSVADWDVIMRSIIQEYGSHQSIGILRSGSILKQVLLSGKDTDHLHSNALDKLYDLPERSPFIAYPIKERVKANVKDQYEVQDFLNMTTLEDLKSLPPEKRPPMPKLLNYILDCLKGLRFLHQNGLVLSDFRPDNIGVNLDSDTGMLFDLDSLYQEGDKAPYVAHPRYIPKDIVSPNTPRVYEEVHAVSEFGTTIFNLLEDQLPELKEFAERMNGPRYLPIPPPSLDEVIEKLEQYI